MVEHTVRLGMPLTEFVEQYNQQPFELIDEENIPLSPNVAGHQEMTMKLYTLLDVLARQHNLGNVIIETPFVLSESDDWVSGSRTPDLKFYRAGRLEAYKAATPNYKLKPYALVPDLVIEVVSPTDRYSNLLRKVAAYLDDGVELVWLIYWQRQTINVYQAEVDQVETLRLGETLTGGEVLPGFSVTVKSLFE